MPIIKPKNVKQSILMPNKIGSSDLKNTSPGKKASTENLTNGIAAKAKAEAKQVVDKADDKLDVAIKAAVKKADADKKGETKVTPEEEKKAQELKLAKCELSKAEKAVEIMNLKAQGSHSKGSVNNGSQQTALSNNLGNNQTRHYGHHGMSHRGHGMQGMSLGGLGASGMAMPHTHGGHHTANVVASTVADVISSASGRKH